VKKKKMQTQQTQHTRQLVSDYLGWRLANEGYSQWNIINQVDVTINSRTRICLIMRQMAFEFEKRYNSDYMPMSDQFSMSETYLSDTFPLILKELFQIKPFETAPPTNDNGQKPFECNWCRVIALFGFAGSLAVRCYRSEMPASIDHIVDWTCRFLNYDSRMFHWIESKGGWVS
jgi:hypothetical protein